jgi:hypothetical protein
MTKTKKREKMPKWIWKLRRPGLSYVIKKFLDYIWWCQDRGCRDWDYQLAERFDRSKRTMRRWIKLVRDLQLVNVQFPSTKSRTVYRMQYYDELIWLYKKGEISLAQMRQRRDNRGKRWVAGVQNSEAGKRTKMSYTYIAQHKKNYTSSSYAITAGPKKDVSPPPIIKDTEKPGESLSRDSVPNPASPSGLTGNQRFKGVKPEIEAKIVKMMVDDKTRHFIEMGYEPDRAHILAEAVVVDQRAKSQEENQKRKE